MKYLCTIYGDESQMASATPEQVNAMLEAYGAFGQEAGDAIPRGRGASADLHGDHRARSRRRAHAHRRALR